MSDRDAYELLGLRPNATPAEIRAAFRKMVMQHHPDRAIGEIDNGALLDVIGAYRRLIDRLPGANHEATQADGEAKSETCSICMGLTRVRSAAVCPACDGRGEMVSLDMGGARWARCTTCLGRGQVLRTDPCSKCSGDQR